MSYQARPARRSLKLIGLYVKGLAGAVVLCAVLYALARFGALPGWVSLLGGLLCIFVCLGTPEAIRATTLYEIDDHQVRSTYGIINRRQETIPSRGVLSCEVQQSVIERFLLRTGTVVFASGATSAEADDIRFFGITSPQAAVKALRFGQPDTQQPPTQGNGVSQPAVEVSAPGQSSQTGPAQMPPL